MRIRARRPVTVIAAALVLPFALAGCGLLGAVAGEPGPPPEDAAAKARERVQGYLDAMKAKDVTLGRAQLCQPMQASFDRAATGPNGDFAAHFTVVQTVITDVRANGGNQEVSTAITVTAPGQDAPIDILFTVTKTGGQWCIAGEAPGGNAAPSPTASASTS